MIMQKRSKWGFALALVLTWMALGAAFADGAKSTGSFDFALLGDPQIGYGRGGEYADAGRFAKVIESINQSKLPLSIIAGDLVQDRSIWQEWTFDGMLSRLQGKVVLAVGNHDVVDEGSLVSYRARHGKDYFDVVYENTAFIVLDSETARDRGISGTEFDAQWAFLEKKLVEHQGALRDHIVLVMHRPPFVYTEDEDGKGENWPVDTRNRLLSLARKHGVRYILAGHLHRTAEIKTQDGIQILVSAGSARSFDQSPIAYYRVHVDETGLSHQLVKVAPAPAEPFSVPGLREWTPRIFDFSVRHWIFSILYALSGFFALRASRALKGQGQDIPKQTLWLGIALLLFFFAANMQLDFDELIGEIGRIVAKVSGVFAVRHLITAVAALVVAAGSAVWLFRLYARSTRDRQVPLALSMLAIPTAWFCLSVISNHTIGMLFNEMWWDSLILVAMIVLCVVAASTAKRVRA